MKNKIKNVRKINEYESEISILGEIIAQGQSTYIIQPYGDFMPDDLKIDNPIIIISSDKNKLKLLRSVLGPSNVEKFTAKKINNTIYPDIIRFIKEDYNVDIFFAKKMDNILIRDSIDKSNILIKFFNSIRNEYYYELDMSYVEDILEYINTYIKKNQKLLNEFEKIVIKAVKSSFRKIGKIEDYQSCFFNIDLHSGQFIQDEKNKIYCIDFIY